MQFNVFGAVGVAGLVRCIAANIVDWRMGAGRTFLANWKGA